MKELDFTFDASCISYNCQQYCDFKFIFNVPENIKENPLSSHFIHALCSFFKYFIKSVSSLSYEGFFSSLLLNINQLYIQLHYRSNLFCYFPNAKLFFLPSVVIIILYVLFINNFPKNFTYSLFLFFSLFYSQTFLVFFIL